MKEKMLGFLKRCRVIERTVVAASPGKSGGAFRGSSLPKEAYHPVQ